MKTRRGCLLQRGKGQKKAWLCQTVDNDGKRTSQLLRKPDGTPCRTKEEALAARVEFMRVFTASDKLESLATLASRMEGVKAEIAKHEDMENPPLTIAGAWSAFRAYLDAPKRKIIGQRTIAPSAATLPMYMNIFQQFADWMKEKHPATLAMRDVTEDMATAYFTLLKKGSSERKKSGLSPNRYNKHRMFLTMLFRILATPAKLTVNPFEGLAVEENTSANYHRELTIEELISVAGAAKGELRTLLAIGIYTGLRLGDCATLRWAEVDLIRGQIKRTPHKTARRHPDPITIPIHPALLKMLAAIPDRTTAEHVLPEIASRYERTPTELVRNIQAHFVSCGIRTVRPGTGKGTKKHPVVEVGFHSLRHTFVSLSRGADAPLSVVEGLVGHSSPAMTRHYTHSSDAARRMAINALPDVSGDVAPNLSLPPADPLTAFKATVAKMLKTMTAKNWKTVRDELIKLAGVV